LVELEKLKDEHIQISKNQENTYNNLLRNKVSIISKLENELKDASMKLIESLRSQQLESEMKLQRELNQLNQLHSQEISSQRQALDTNHNKSISILTSKFNDQINDLNDQHSREIQQKDSSNSRILNMKDEDISKLREEAVIALQRHQEALTNQSNEANRILVEKNKNNDEITNLKVESESNFRKRLNERDQLIATLQEDSFQMIIQNRESTNSALHTQHEQLIKSHKIEIEESLRSQQLESEMKLQREENQINHQHSQEISNQRQSLEMNHNKAISNLTCKFNDQINDLNDQHSNILSINAKNLSIKDKAYDSLKNEIRELEVKHQDTINNLNIKYKNDFEMKKQSLINEHDNIIKEMNLKIVLNDNKYSELVSSLEIHKNNEVINLKEQCDKFDQTLINSINEKDIQHQRAIEVTTDEHSVEIKRMFELLDEETKLKNDLNINYQNEKKNLIKMTSNYENQKHIRLSSEENNSYLLIQEKKKNEKILEDLEKNLNNNNLLKHNEVISNHNIIVNRLEKSIEESESKYNNLSSEFDIISSRYKEDSIKYEINEKEYIENILEKEKEIKDIGIRYEKDLDDQNKELSKIIEDNMDIYKINENNFMEELKLCNENNKKERNEIKKIVILEKKLLEDKNKSELEFTNNTHINEINSEKAKALSELNMLEIAHKLESDSLKNKMSNDFELFSDQSKTLEDALLNSKKRYELELESIRKSNKDNIDKINHDMIIERNEMLNKLTSIQKQSIIIEENHKQELIQSLATQKKELDELHLQDLQTRKEIREQGILDSTFTMKRKIPISLLGNLTIPDAITPIKKGIEDFESASRVSSIVSNRPEMPWEASPCITTSSSDQLIAAILDGDVQGIRTVVRSKGDDLTSAYWKEFSSTLLPLHRAISGLHFHGKDSLVIASIETLIQVGADISICDNAGNSVIHKALTVCTSKSVAPVIQVLLSRGASAVTRNNEGNTPLHIECQR
jgi:hypothetical protein